MSSNKSDATHERLLDTALQLLVEGGYHQVGMDEIARAAGVSRQAVYQGHFRSKAELLLAMVRRENERVDIPGRISRIREAGSGVEALEYAVEAIMSIERDIHAVARVFEAARIEDPAFEEAWQDQMGQRRALWARAVVQRLAAEGRLAEGWTLDEAADLLWATTSGWTYQALVVERGWSLERCIDLLKQLLRGAFVRVPPASGGSKDGR